MADKVQLTLETLVPEMDVLVQKGYFEKKDIKKIMKKRRFHEYQFEKTDVQPIDYFRAIKYEKILNKRMKQKKKSLHIKKNDYYDFHFIRRIIILYKKSLIKFNKYNEKIWMEYFNFLLVNKCNDILNKEIGRCITMYPTKIVYWKIAAYHEYEDNLNFQNARNLFQKCIKLNPGNLDAYLEYFTFELIFAENYTQRKNILSGNNIKEEKDNKSKKKKIAIVNDIKAEKEKMNEDKEEEEKNENNKNNDKNTNNNGNNNNDNNNDIKNLIIPDVIYDDAITKLINDKNKNKIDDLLLIHFGFLERLEKYGTSENLNYKNLENKINNNIINILNNNNDKNELFLIDNHIKIIKIKILKYSKEELLNKIKIVFNEFENNLYINKYKNYYNYISYHFIQYFLNEEEKNENIQNNINDNNEAYMGEIIKLIKPKINIDKFNKEILLYNNIKLLGLISSKEYLITNLLTTENYDIHKNIFDILKLIFNQNDLPSLKEAFIIINNIRNDIDLFVEKITQIPINYAHNNDNCFNLLKYYIQKFIELISDEMTYYIKPELMKNYFEMINNQFEKGKVNFILLKELYYKMIELIVNKCIQINDNDKNEDGKKYYEIAYKYVKGKMEKYLINGKNIINEIISKISKNNKTYLKFLQWIE